MGERRLPAPGPAGAQDSGNDRERIDERLWRHLREAGVTAVYGDAGHGIPVTAPAPPALARVLAVAHERVHHRRAVTWSDGFLGFGQARVAEGPAGGATWTLIADDAAGLAEILAVAVAEASAGRGLRVRVDLDLDAPAGPRRHAVAAPARDPAADVAALVERLTTARHPVALCGPGVVTAAAVPGLHALATAGRLGVLNTWGAKGVFPWQSPHHWATVGLQRDDFRLGGLAESDLVVAVGVDEHESPAEQWQLAEHVEIPPGSLAAVATAWRRDGAWMPMPRLRDLLAAVTQRGWAVATAPLPPSRVTRAYGELVAGSGGLVAADPGVAGFWVARTVGTTVLGSVVVPAEPVGEGFAVACGLVARIAVPARAVLAVTDDAVGERGSALLDLADGLGLPVPVEVWAGDGRRPDADAHAERLDDAVRSPRRQVLTLETDAAQIDEMIEAAGPVVAWAGTPAAVGAAPAAPVGSDCPGIC